jgi:hypothetical protein
LGQEDTKRRFARGGGPHHGYYFWLLHPTLVPRYMKKRKHPFGVLGGGLNGM